MMAIRIKGKEASVFGTKTIQKKRQINACGRVFLYCESRQPFIAGYCENIYYAQYGNLMQFFFGHVHLLFFLPPKILPCCPVNSGLSLP